MSLKIHKTLYSSRTIAILMAIISLGITSQLFLRKEKKFEENGPSYTHYNNYIIFKNSFSHLVEGKNLYAPYPCEHWDYYKYSPTFALLMAPFAMLPDYAGLALWNLLNVFILYYAFRKLPFRDEKARLLAIGFFLIELITSIQSSQSNPLIAGIIILAFILLESRKVALASLLIVLSIFIKLIGIVALCLFIFHPGKLRSIAYTFGWTLVLMLLPLLIISFEQLTFLYKSWFALLATDHDTSYGFSIMGWLRTWFGLDPGKNAVVLLGGLLFCIPLLKYKCYTEQHFRILFLSNILLWVVIFNHMAESPTFIIAVSGISIWYFLQDKKKVNLILLLLALVFTVFSATDLFPASVRKGYMLPYVIKVVPCILVWGKIMMELFSYKKSGMLKNES